MEIQPPGSRAFVIYAQPKPSWIKEHILFRIGVFTLSIVAGYLFTLSLYTGLHLLAPLPGGTHETANPLLEILRMLYSGFSR
jgi:hypothetical protein